MASKTAKIIIVSLVLLAVVQAAFAIKSFRVQETDLVTLTPEAIDPDEDAVEYSYSPPLDKNGQWQTGYDDAGEYLLKINASDGVTSTTKEVLLIVDNKNQPPYLNEKKVRVKELQSIDLKQFVADPDNDPLQYSFSKPFDSSGIWKPSYNDQGSFVTSFTINDGEFAVPVKLEVDVVNTNQPPLIQVTFSEEKVVRLQENEELSFFATVEEGDGDAVSYLWTLNEKVIEDTSQGHYFFDFDSAGEHLLTLVVSDGLKTVQKEWLVQVENINREPELDLSPITVEEGETIQLSLPTKDADGDILTYSFEEKFNEEGIWKTSFDDAGSHSLSIYVSDGKKTVKERIKVTVLDVDQPPLLLLPSRLEVREGEELSFTVEALDPDGDDVSVTVENAPEGALFMSESKTLSWKPGYDFISRRYGLLSNILNSLRLEQRLLQVKKINLHVNACSKEFCTSSFLPLLVYNTNRAPTLEIPTNITVTEMEVVSLKPLALDPDGDIVRFSFSEPLDDEGNWKTNYNDAARYVMYVNVNDGSASQTLPIDVTVLQKNRPPTLKVPRDKAVVNEGEEFSLSLKAADPDGDTLFMRVEDLPPGALFANNSFTWKPGYEIVHNVTPDDSLLSEVSWLSKKFASAEIERWISFVVSDGEFEVYHPVKVVIREVNQPPEVIDLLPVEAATIIQNKPLLFKVNARDNDGDDLIYSWNFGSGEEITGTAAVERTFVNSGEKNVRVTVSDGQSEVQHQWKVTVLEDKVPTEVASEIPSVALEAAEPVKFKVYVIEH